MIATQPKQKELSLGFIGVGWIGRNRMQAILQHIKTGKIALTEPAEENAEQALKDAGKGVLVDSPEEICEAPDLDGIVIATPSALHAQQSITALKAGKAVFCQKPLGRTASEVKEVVAASKKMDKLLAVDLSYRYTNAFRAVYDVIQKGEI
ncbi:MAG TPA: Gfo/Idh/MocA family oxidoreductase, partial [Salinimicrobium sp.]|nr:Gfo/Idh/MocA family oxidoreductase [Salinimicrobium sp.]